MLAFLEHPSSLSISCDMTMPKEYLERYEFPCGALESIDLFCLTIFLADCIIKVYLTLSSESFIQFILCVFT